MVPSICCKDGDLLGVKVVNAKDREEREVEEALPGVEQRCGKVLAEVDEEIEEEEEADAGSGMGKDITFL